MARQARRRSCSDYYHLIVRGIGRQVLFEEPKDYRYFLNLLRRNSADCGLSVCAYCLMENHVHLLVNDPDFCQSLFMKKIGICYASYYNRKYERTGHLFQDRFLSELIENEPALLNVFRYILNNPAKAGISAAASYEWSSFSEYAVSGSFVDTAIFQKLIGGRDRFRAFMNGEEIDRQHECGGADQDFLDFDSKRNDDRWAQGVICSHLQGRSGTFLQTMDRMERNLVLRELKEEGMSVRQIERLTGINRNIVQRA